MRFNHLIKSTELSETAHGGCPASGGLTTGLATRMPDAGASSQLKRRRNLGRYTPLFLPPPDFCLSKPDTAELGSVALREVTA